MLTKLILLSPSDYQNIKNELSNTNSDTPRPKLSEETPKTEVMKEWLKIRNQMVADSLHRRKYLREHEEKPSAPTSKRSLDDDDDDDDDFIDPKKVKTEKKTKKKHKKKKVKKEKKSDDSDGDETFFTGEEDDSDVPETPKSPVVDAKRKLFKTDPTETNKNTYKKSKSKSRRERRRKNKIYEENLERRATLRPKKKKQSGQGVNFKFIKFWDSL